MANEEQVAILNKDVAAWNAWRRENSNIFPDLSGANLSGANLSAADLSEANLREVNLRGADLREVNLREADLREVNLREADLRGADLRRADLFEANLQKTNLSGADLRGAWLTLADLRSADLRVADLRGAQLDEADLQATDLRWANLSGASLGRAYLGGAYLDEANLREASLIVVNLYNAYLKHANLSKADLTHATLVHTDLTDADLTGCRIYGVSAWDLKLEGAKQQNLVITDEGTPDVTVDDLEVGQFIYLLLHNEKLQKVIDTITTKVVLILGCFSLPERKRVLDGLRDELRKPGRDYVPVVFDFENPPSQTTINTVMLLARMARFVIADITDAKCVLMELQAIVPSSPLLAVQPIIVAAQELPGMFDSFKAYPWVLEVHRYDTPGQLLAHLDERVIRLVEKKVTELRG
jgi:uncharacterized protein YjbI with pentapeptide repeats